MLTTLNRCYPRWNARAVAMTTQHMHVINAPVEVIAAFTEQVVMANIMGKGHFRTPLPPNMFKTPKTISTMWACTPHAKFHA